MTLEIGALIIQEFVVGGRKIFGKFACSDTDIWLQCSAFTGQDRGCGRLLRCCIIIPCLRSLKRRDTWPDIRRIAQLSSSTVTLTPLCGQCRTQLSHITAHCRENILTLHHLHWIWKHAKDPTQSLAWLNIHWSCCKTGYVMMILTVIVEFCSHVSFTDMMTDDRTELNVLTLYHYNWEWSLSADRCAEHQVSLCGCCPAAGSVTTEVLRCVYRNNSPSAAACGAALLRRTGPTHRTTPSSFHHTHGGGGGHRWTPAFSPPHLSYFHCEGAHI